MLTVCFTCATEYHVFVASVLAATEYKSHKKIIILPKSDRFIRVSDRLSKINVWDAVHEISDNVSRDNVLEQLENIDHKSIDVLHYFSFYDRPSNLLFGLVKSHADIILTDEGMLTYDFIDAYEKHSTTQQVELFDQDLDFNRIKSIWVFNQEVVNDRKGIPIKEIDFLKKFDKIKNKQKIIEVLNYIFGFEYNEIDSDIIFFDQYYSFVGLVDIEVEKYIIEQISKCVTKGKVLVKPHPAEGFFEKYGDANVDYLDVNRTPWEVVLLNQIFNRKENKKLFLISYNSTSLINSILLKSLDFEVHIAFIYKIIRKYAYRKIPDATILKIEECYSSDLVSTPDNFTELRRIIEQKSNCGVKSNYVELHCEEQENELNWLRESRIRWSKVSPVRPLHLSSLDVWITGIQQKQSENVHIALSENHNYQVYYDISKYNEISGLRFTLAQLPASSCKIKKIDTDGVVDNVTPIRYEECLDGKCFFINKPAAFNIDGDFNNATYIKVDFEFDHSENALNQVYFSLKEKVSKPLEYFATTGKLV